MGDDYDSFTSRITVVVEIEDDPVMHVVQAVKKVPMKLDRVPGLTDKTFPKYKDSSASVILFYFPCKCFD